ncbi:retrotransposon protein [Cucumis melo var. makuwa]|uniref:Retrotransposon protein n=1 Tax=Cucumis melo var. makuwa TaxID=1194695 RepID=A0A5A7SMS4_CUCMM|nr:retrotransposon protein [Cucumis melo var. makuwa]
MYSQGLDMSLDKVMETRVARASDGRHVSSGSKQKWGGPFVDSGNVIRIAIEYDNEQLNRITDSPVLQHQDASTTRQEVV